MSEGGKEAVRADDEVVAKAEVLTLQKQIRCRESWARRPRRTRFCVRR